MLLLLAFTFVRSGRFGLALDLSVPVAVGRWAKWESHGLGDMSKALRPHLRKAVPFSVAGLGELPIELSNIALAQKGVSVLKRSDTGKATFLGQAVLPRAEKWLLRLLPNAQNRPLVSITSRSPPITVRVHSASTNCA